MKKQKEHGLCENVGQSFCPDRGSKEDPHRENKLHG
jgi:hypothetical protein